MRTITRTQGVDFDVFGPDTRGPRCPTCGGHLDEITSHDDLPTRRYICRQSCTLTEVLPNPEHTP